jgi:AhpD family alkylhydroperoxidase
LPDAVGRKAQNWSYQSGAPAPTSSIVTRKEDDMHAHRLNAYEFAPAGMKTLQAVEAYLHQTTLGPQLIELVKMRASQINGCAYCLDMHTKDARSMGETEQRLYTLSAWRETPFFTERERAALALTEAVTLVSIDHVPDEVYAQAHTQFNDAELVDLVMAAATINTWNRLAITFRAEAGHYKPPDRIKERAATAQQK